MSTMIINHNDNNKYRTIGKYQSLIFLSLFNWTSGILILPSNYIYMNMIIFHVKLYLNIFIQFNLPTYFNALLRIIQLQSIFIK